MDTGRPYPQQKYDLHRVQVGADGSITLQWRHYKNACKGGWVGDGQVVKTTPSITGQLFQDIFKLWVDWGRGLWLGYAELDDPSQVTNTFVDMGGDSFQSSENPSGTNMSMWMRSTLQGLFVTSEHFNDEELRNLQAFTVQAARYGLPVYGLPKYDRLRYGG